MFPHLLLIGDQSSGNIQVIEITPMDGGIVPNIHPYDNSHLSKQGTRHQ